MKKIEYMIKDFDQLYEKLSQHIDDKNRDTVDLLRQEIRASKKEAVGEITEFIADHIVPQIDEQHDKTQNHENRIITLEEKVKA